MKLRTVEDHKKDWQTTASSLIALILAILVGVKVISAEQSAQLLPVLGNILQAVVAVIGAVTFIINMFFKKSTT